MSSHRKCSSRGRVARGTIPPAALAVVAGLALACSGDTTSGSLQAPEPSFHHRAGHGGGPGGGDGGDPAPARQFDLLDPAGLAGVYPDVPDPYPSTMLDEAGGLHPTCGVRFFELRPEDMTSPNDSVFPTGELQAILENQSRCDGATGRSDPRRAFLKAPDMLLQTEDCDSDPATLVADCRSDFGGFLDTYPSYEWKGNRIKPTGWFTNAARHFEVDEVTGHQRTWVFQDPKVTIVTRDEDGAPTAWRFQATTIHLYGHPDWELCVGGGDTDRDGVPENCLPFALSVDFTVEPEPEGT